MERLSFMVLIVMLCYCCGYNVQSKEYQNAKSIEEKFDLLIERIEELEGKNERLELKVLHMDRNFKEKEKHFNERITDLQRKTRFVIEICGKDSKLAADDTAPNLHYQAATKNRLTNSSLLKSKYNDGRKKENVVKTYSDQRIRRSAEQWNIAFFATVSPHLKRHLGVNQTIVFDNAQTNIGDAYSTRHGYFTAPIDGVYVFSTTIAGVYNNKIIYASVNVNGQIVVRMVLDSKSYSHTGQTVVVQLKRHDEVSIRNDETDDTILGDRYTSFSGFLLFEREYSSTQIIGK